MTPPQPGPPSQPHGQVTLNCCLSGIGAATGVAACSWWGAMKFGWVGALVGLPVGAVAGVLGMWAVYFAMYLVAALVVAPVVILVVQGRRALWDYVRGRWQPPGEPTPQPAADPAGTAEDEEEDNDGTSGTGNDEPV